MAENVVDFFSSSAEEFASAYGKDPDFRDRLALWRDVLGTYSRGKKTAIDMGCGPGLYSFYLSKLGMQVVGLDAAPGMIRLCQERKEKEKMESCEFLHANFPNLPKELSPADIILCSSVLEYIPDLENAIAVLASYLRTDGLLILSLPNSQSIYRKWERFRFACTGTPDYFRFVKNLVRAEDFKQMMNGKGFRCEKIVFYAHANLLSKIGRPFLNENRTENLFLGVFRKL